MSTLVIFAALIFLVNALRFDPEVTKIATIVLAVIGIIAFILRCVGTHIPQWMIN